MKPWSKADRDMARALRIWLDPLSLDTFKIAGLCPDCETAPVPRQHRPRRAPGRCTWRWEVQGSYG